MNETIKQVGPSPRLSWPKVYVDDLLGVVVRTTEQVEVLHAASRNSNAVARGAHGRIAPVGGLLRASRLPHCGIRVLVSDKSNKSVSSVKTPFHCCRVSNSQ